MDWNLIEDEDNESLEQLAKEVGKLWREYRDGDMGPEEFLERVEAVVSSRE